MHDAMNFLADFHLLKVLHCQIMSMTLANANLG